MRNFGLCILNADGTTSCAKPGAGFLTPDIAMPIIATPPQVAPPVVMPISAQAPAGSSVPPSDNFSAQAIPATPPVQMTATAKVGMAAPYYWGPIVGIGLIAYFLWKKRH